MVVTVEVVQPAMLLLKPVALSNMLRMVPTLETSQPEMSPLKSGAE